MSDEIAVGDVVKLKSGGPLMTVVTIDRTQFDTDLSVWCEWFDEKNKSQKGTFKLVAVQKPDTSQPELSTAPKRRVKTISKA